MANIVNAPGPGRIVGTAQDDFITPDWNGTYPDGGVADNDVIRAGGGQDIIYGTTGADDIDGGPGFDRVDFSSWVPVEDAEGRPWGSVYAWAIIVDYGAGTYEVDWRREDGDEMVVVAEGSGTLTDVEMVVGGRGPDGHLGSSDDETFWLSEGRAVVNGRGGEDRIEIWSFRTSVLTGEGLDIDVAAGRMTSLDGSLVRFRNVEGFPSTAYDDIFRGDDGDQSLTASAGADDLRAGGGRDSLDLALVTGAVYDAAAGSLTVTDFGGMRHQQTVRGFEVVDGGRGRDVMRGRDAAETFDGRGGRDVLAGRGGDDLLDGGSGDDVLLGGAGEDMLRGGFDDGADRLNGGAGADELAGRGGADVLRGGGAADLLDGGPGDDEIRGGRGKDWLLFDLQGSEAPPAGVEADFGAGRATDPWGDSDTFRGISAATGTRHADTLSGAAGAQTLFGGAGGDRLEGGQGEDSLEGQDGRDTLTGGGAKDLLWGGAGRDRLEGGGGPDRLFGGDGRDRIDGDSGADFVQAAGDDDRVFGGFGADTLMGEAGDDTVSGSAGADALNGGQDDDVVRGGLGDDVLGLSTGVDTLQGGFGSDTLDAAGATQGLVQFVLDEGIEVNLATGRMLLEDGRGSATLDSVEAVWGTDHDDRLVGSLFGNLLEGRDGDDRLAGRNGADTLLGGRGEDVLRGGGWRDSLEGGGAADRLHGDGSADILDGGGGADRIRGGGGGDRLTGGAGRDLLDGGSGRDTLEGGAGADIFVFSQGQDRVLDFDIARDVIVVDRRAAEQYRDLADVAADVARPGAADAVIDADSAELTLAGVRFVDLTAANFDFA